MDDLWWYLSRSTGVVATLLAVAALVWGLFFSARNTGPKRTAAWWLDLHNYLGGLALVFTGAHLLTAALDPNSGIGVVQIVIPGTSSVAGWALTWGVLATYIFAITVFTSWPKRRFSRRVWRIVHLTSVAGVAFAGIHGLQMGSDSDSLLFRGGLLACAGVAVYGIALRAIGVIGRSVGESRNSQR